MSFFTVEVTLPATVELTICATSEQVARRAAEEFVSTAFAEALRFWDHDEPIIDSAGQLLGAVQIDMPNEGEIELPMGAVEITARKESRQ
jgi:hypothetical protein